MPQIIEEYIVALILHGALGLLEAPPDKVEDLLELLLLPILVMVLLDKLQVLLAPVGIVQHFRMRVRHEAVDFRRDEIPGGLDRRDAM